MKIQRLVVSLAVTGTFLLPQTGRTTLRASNSWGKMSAAAAPRAAAVSIGIGGLRSTFSSSLRLSESALRYNNGVLTATTADATISARIDPLELLQGLHVVQSTADSEFEVSADPGMAGMYIEEALKDTTIGTGFGIADLDFSLYAYDKRSLPKGAAKHPYVQGAQLLGSDDEYTRMTGDWREPPGSWPQIFLRFDPAIVGHVRLEFNPQLLFRDIQGNTVEVDARTLALAEKPYRDMVADVAARPVAYRNNSPAIAHAAELTIALGLLRAACSRQDSCEGLVLSILGDDEAEAEARMERAKKALGKRYASIEDSYQQANKVDSTSHSTFVHKWSRLASASRSFTVGPSDRSWALAYDMTHSAALAALDEDRLAAARKQLKVLKPQFALAVPEDALLQAAAGLVSAGRGDAKGAKRALDKALVLSQEYPVDRVTVTLFGQAAAMMLADTDITAALALAKRMTSASDAAKIAAYDEIAGIVDGCVAAPKTCKSSAVRTLESEIRNAFLADNMAVRDVPYLRGRIDYVVGVLEPKGTRDRLRFLEQRIAAAQQQHQDELRQLEGKLRTNLAQR